MRKKTISICFDDEVGYLIDKDIDRIEVESGVRLSRSAYISALVRRYAKKDDSVCDKE